MFNIDEIVQGCKKRNARAQKQFYNMYYKQVFNCCVRILSNRMDAEDCMQETFMKAFEKIDAIEDAPPEAWVKRIAINTSINRLKKNCINFVDLDHPAVVYNDEDEDFEEGSTPAEEMVERIRVRMKELPDKYRVILSLYLFEGYDHGEIAEILDLKETTVRSQFIRGKQKLIELVTKNDKLCI